ncbi:MAG TPA: hypothetical protein VMU95_18585 [Trebonia sp.]|nr:hypothetical protein [Trebonia sp.]
MTAPDTLSRSHGPFPNVARLGRFGPDAATRLTAASAQLRVAGAPDSAKRVVDIDREVTRGDYATLEALVDPQRAENELAAAQQPKVRLAHTVRNSLALVPLLLTWIALGFASQAYRAELQAHPDQSTKPFLLLWSQGFGSGFPSFTQVALGDFALLVLVLAATVWVHQAEGRATRTQDKAIDSLYGALDTLEVAVEQSIVPAPASAQEWAEAAQRIIAGAMEETRLLAQTSQQAIEEAGARLAGIQDQGRDFIAQFSREIQQTLAAVREDNEQFINRTATEARETLQHLVEQQMDPLLAQLSAMLAEFSRHQDAYRAATVDLSHGVTGVRESARELAESAHAYNEVADSVSRSLTAIETSQRDFTAQVTGSADSMATAARAMGEFHGTLTEMHDGVQGMATNVTAAGTTLEAVERRLADTSTALRDSTAALNRVTHDLRGTTRGWYGGHAPRRRLLAWPPFSRR